VDAAEHAGTSADWLVRRADAAMYAGKRGGKNTLVRYHLDLADENGSSDLSELLRAALISERGLDVHYQPIVRLADGTVVAVEALARWTDPVVGPVPADLFIAVAERAGLVGLVDDFVLDRACQDAADFAGAWRDVVMHVNVSAARFGEPEQVAGVLRALHRHRLPANRLLLELTETARLDDLTTAAVVAARLHDRGVQIGLDDFGTGYASLTHLRRLPLTFVKIDRSFVAGIGTDEEDERIVSAVVDLAANLGLRSIAEGVETADQLARLRALGCDQAQGFLFSRPMPSEEVPVAIGHAPW
jgi:EAL domain-containing protein (putative c-di-GMP-specific phosphodiesterase class I)